MFELKFSFWYCCVLSALKGNQQNTVNLHNTFLKCNTRSHNQQNTVNCIKYIFKSSAWRWLHRNEPKHV